MYIHVYSIPYTPYICTCIYIYLLIRHWYYSVLILDLLMLSSNLLSVKTCTVLLKDYVVYRTKYSWLTLYLIIIQIGRTALHYAKNAEVCKLLLNHGANIEVTDQVSLNVVSIINPWCACTVRVTVVVLCVCLLLLFWLRMWCPTKHTNSFS